MRSLLLRTSQLSAIAAIALLAVFGALTLTSSPAFAHDELVGQEVTSASDGGEEAVHLTYSNSIIEVGTEVQVTAPDGVSVTDGAPKIDGPLVEQRLTPDLAPGEYQGAWRVVSSDGHAIEGAFVVTIGNDGAATIESGQVSGGEATGEEPASESEEPAATAEEQSDSGPGIGTLIAVVAVAVVVIGATVVVGTRRRARGIANASGEPREEK